MFLSLGILLGVARILGEAAQKLHQPAVLGELVAGVLLGPTVLGNLAPDFSAFVFPKEGPSAIALNAISTLAITLFLMVAGIEVDLSTIWRQGKVGLKTGITSIAIPFCIGIVLAWRFPEMMGRHFDTTPMIFALFFATALSISALPVIAKTLMDMQLYRSDLGMIIVSAAIFNDLIGWIVFAVILGMIGNVNGHSNHIGLTITLTLFFAGAMLTLGRWLIHKIIPILQAYTQWPGGVLGFALTLTMLGAAFTEWIGVHAIFGAFLVGVAIGDSSHLRERTRVTIEHFVSFIFAPLFFATIGLKVDFLAHFDFRLIMTVLIVSCVCKLIGGYGGARWGGLPSREAWVVGFAMNSRGAMEIILGILALEAGIISERLFVALVIMAMITSMISGPMMGFSLRSGRKRRSFWRILSPELFFRKLNAQERQEAIWEMSRKLCDRAGLDVEQIADAVWAREASVGTGIGNGVALPHARIDGISKPLVAVGISEAGIDFDAPDGKAAHILFLVLSPKNSSGAQLEIFSEIARLFRNPHLIELILRTKNYTEFLALMKTAIASAPAFKKHQA
jgi:Kef-type K+ transport system membrane component KefB